MYTYYRPLQGGAGFASKGRASLLKQNKANNAEQEKAFKTAISSATRSYGKQVKQSFSSPGAFVKALGHELADPNSYARTAAGFVSPVANAANAAQIIAQRAIADKGAGIKHALTDPKELAKQFTDPTSSTRLAASAFLPSAAARNTIAVVNATQEALENAGQEAVGRGRGRRYNKRVQPRLAQRRRIMHALGGTKRTNLGPDLAKDALSIAQAHMWGPALASPAIRAKEARRAQDMQDMQKAVDAANAARLFYYIQSNDHYFLPHAWEYNEGLNTRLWQSYYDATQEAKRASTAMHQARERKRRDYENYQDQFDIEMALGRHGPAAHALPAVTPR